MPTPAARRALVALGVRIAETRRDRGLTQEQLAELTGFSLRYIQSLEAGDGNPSVETVVAIAVSLHADLASLFRATPVAPQRRRGRPRSS